MRISLKWLSHSVLYLARPACPDEDTRQCTTTEALLKVKSDTAASSRQIGTRTQIRGQANIETW